MKKGARPRKQWQTGQHDTEQIKVAESSVHIPMPYDILELYVTLL